MKFFYYMLATTLCMSACSKSDVPTPPVEKEEPTPKPEEGGGEDGDGEPPKEPYIKKIGRIPSPIIILPVTSAKTYIWAAYGIYGTLQTR